MSPVGWYPNEGEGLTLAGIVLQSSRPGAVQAKLRATPPEWPSSWPQIVMDVERSVGGTMPWCWAVCVKVSALVETQDVRIAFGRAPTQDAAKSAAVKAASDWLRGMLGALEEPVPDFAAIVDELRTVGIVPHGEASGALIHMQGEGVDPLFLFPDPSLTYADFCKRGWEMEQLVLGAVRRAREMIAERRAAGASEIEKIRARFNGGSDLHRLGRTEEGRAEWASAIASAEEYAEGLKGVARAEAFKVAAGLSMAAGQARQAVRLAKLALESDADLPLQVRAELWTILNMVKAGDLS